MRVIYPGDKRIQLDGGLNNKFERSIIEDNESPSCLNVTCEEGAVGTRGGTSRLTTSGLGSIHFNGTYNHKTTSGDQTMVAWMGGSMYTLESNTFVTVPSAQSVYTADVNVCAAQYEGYIFMGNGGTYPYKYNGTDFTRHGVYPPATAPTITSAGTAGNLLGTYTWKVTYVNTNLVEGDLSTASTALSLTSEIATLGDISVAPQSYGVNYRKLYRKSSAASTYKLITTFNDNTTTTYSDNTADANVGADAPTDQGLPPNYSACIYFRDRLFVNDPSNPNYVWYSELGNPYVFKALSFFKFGDNSTDIVKCFGIVQNALVVFGESSFMFVYMPDTDTGNWAYVQGAKQYGCKSPKGIFNFEDKLMFPAVQNDKFVGFAALNATGIDQDATYLSVLNAVSDLYSNRIEPDIFLIQEAYLHNIEAIVYKNKAYISVSYGAGQTTNNRIYQFDFSNSNVSKKQRYTWIPWSGLNAKNFVIYEGVLYYTDSTGNNGLTYEMFDGTYSDDGNAIDSYFWTKEFGGYKKDLHFHKDFRGAYILAEQTGAWYMDMYVRVDSDSTGGALYTIDLNPGGSTWGSMDWGVDDWGGGNDQVEEVVSLNQSGKRIQFKFSNENKVNQWFKIHGLGFGYNKKGLR